MSTTSNNEPNHAVIFAVVARELAASWQGKAERFAVDKNYSEDFRNGVAAGIRQCARQLIGLCDVADTQVSDQEV